MASGNPTWQRTLILRGGRPSSGGGVDSASMREILMGMRPRSIIGLLLGLALLAATMAACGDDGTGDSAEAASAPEFSAETLDGVELVSADLQGPTVLWFWAPWCTICRAEAPGVVDAATTLGDDVTVIGVAGRGEVDAMDEFVGETGTGSLTHVVDDDGSIWAAYGVTSQPAFAFIGADGELDEVVVGAIGEDGLVDRATALVG